MNLFIVESPAKIKKICSLLGKTYIGASSYGHIMDLAKNNMSIEFENNFNPIYVINDDKKKVVKELVKAAKNAKEILIATDKDREGEMIAWNIAQALKLKNPKRIVFTSITKKSLQEAIKNVGTIDYNMVNSQKCRRVLDRLVGYELSPVLDSFMNSHNLSAGRVQSVVARLIVDRENEIENFFAANSINSHFQINGTFNIKKQKPRLKASLYTKKAPLTTTPFKGDQSKIPTKTEAENLLTEMMSSIFKIQNVFVKKRIQSPSPPYTTSTLQQDASHKLSFNGRRTMLAAQHLYEAGYITYMRTDSTALCDEALKKIEEYILENHDKIYYKKTIYKTNDNAQGAHECIRPTEISTTELQEIDGNDKIKQDEIRLYKLIWKRTVASQMAPAEYDDLNIQISISNLDKYYFSTCISALTFDGFLVLYKNINENKEEEEEEENMSDTNTKLNTNTKINTKLFTENTELDAVNIKAQQEYDKPPPRYNESSLLNKLDIKNLNIGRPATLVTIIQKILEKKYAEVKDTKGKDFKAFTLTWTKNKEEITEESKTITLAKEKNKFMPTKLGIDVTNYLTLHFSKIMDYKFTANMEQKLDEIANGNLIWHEVIKEFYDEFHPLVMARVSVNNINKGANLKLLGKYENKDIYATTAKYGPVIKYLDGETVKFLKIVEPLTIETITLGQAIEVIEKNSEYPKLIGLFDRKQIILRKNNDSYYISYNKKTFPSDKPNLTLDEAIKIIKSNGKVPLFQLKNGFKICSVYQGKENRYMNILNTKTKNSYNIPLPDDEIIENLTLERINAIVNERFNKK